MLHNGIQFLGDSFATENIAVKNVTATSAVAGGIYALDIPAADSDTNGAANVVRAELGNLVAVTSANLHGVLAIPSKKILPGETGSAVIAGFVSVKVNGTTDIAKGDRLKASAGSAVLTKATTNDVGVGLALEAFTTNADGSIKALFDGVSFNKKQ